MPFGFKLSHRLSRIKRRAVMTSIAAAAVVAACQTDRIGPGSEKLVASVVITPDSISLDPQQTQQFHVFGRTPAGESTAVAVTWSASVGTITPNGLFTADTTSDDAIVTATLTSSGVTATTRIRKRRVVAVVLTPAAVTMPPGSTAQFVAYGRRNIGDSTSVAVTYAATGGTITPGGLYTAGPTEGTFRVIAVRTGGTLADTAAVTIQASATPPPTVVRLILSPATTTLAAAATQQFSTVGKYSDSSTTAVPVTYTATGGTITTGGLYTAGPTAGTFRVIAAQTGGSLADTSAVTIQATPVPSAAECANRQPGWIWCDDFEQDRLSSYFEYNADNGSFTRAASVGRGGSYGMRIQFAAGQQSAGALHLAFGKTPDAYFKPVDAGTATYRDLYWRMYVMHQAGWVGGGGDKLSRALIFASPTWAEAAFAHVWSGSAGNESYLMLDPASGTDPLGTVVTTQYNDFANMRWLGGVRSATPIFDAAHVGSWYCVEAHAKLNDAGQSNGVFQLWINGALEGENTGMNWVGSFSQYGFNALFFESYWNAGSPQAQERYFDNIVVSTQPIGCGGAAPAPAPPPAPAAVASVSVTPLSDTLLPGATAQFAATPKDAAGNPLSGRAVAWTSSNTAVTTVSSAGKATAMTPGAVTITATSDGVAGRANVSVVATPVPPPPPPPSAGAWFEEDFSTYTSTATFLADPRGVYVTAEDADFAGNGVIDAAVGLDVDGRILTRSLRYDYPDRTGSGGRCADYSVGRNLTLPSSVPELWAEFYVRFSSNFTTVAPGGWGCSSNPDLKFIFGRSDAPNGLRWEVKVGNSSNQTWILSYPQVGGAASEQFPFGGNGGSPPAPFDGAWHRFRVHWKCGGSGTVEFWLDGSKLVNHVGDLNAACGSIYGLALGRNLNQGPDHLQSVWWGRIRAWKQNPGW